MKTLRLFTLALMGLLMCGCPMGPGFLSSTGSTPLMVKAEFEKEMQRLFPAPLFEDAGGGSGGGGGEWEYLVMYRLTEEDAPVSFDFKGLGSLITGRDSFTGLGRSENGDLTKQQSWSNADRIIRVEGVHLKGGYIRVRRRKISC